MLRKIMPHVAIILSTMYFVFFCIDRVNSAMGFISSDITKWLLVILGIASIWNSVVLVLDNQKRVERKKTGKSRQSAKLDRDGYAYSESEVARTAPVRTVSAGRGYAHDESARTARSTSRFGSVYSDRDGSDYRRYR